MRNKTVSNSKGLAGWLDDFVVGLSGKSGKEVVASNEEVIEEVVSEIGVEEELETVATININDLEKIVWNEETFRVHFEENGANVINEFGNGVTFLKGLKTIEEVDHALNDKQVIVSSDENVDELVTAEENDFAFEEELTAAINSIPEEELEETVIANQEDELEEAIVANQEEFIPEETEVFDDTLQNNSDQTDEDVMTAIIAGFDEIESRLATVEQAYARSLEFPQDDLATQVQEQEIKDFTEKADVTQQQISNEQSYDLTTPKGRVEISDRRQHNTEVSEVQKIVQEEVNTEVNEEVTEEPVLENDDTQVSDENFEKLTGKDEKIFQNGVCPETGEELVKSKTAGSFLGIYSPKGKTEYAVNLTTGDIFKFKG